MTDTLKSDGWWWVGDRHVPLYVYVCVCVWGEAVTATYQCVEGNSTVFHRGLNQSCAH